MNKAPVEGANNLLVSEQDALLAREASLCAEADSRPFHESEIAVVELARHGVGVDAHADNGVQTLLVRPVHDELATSKSGINVDLFDSGQLLDVIKNGAKVPSVCGNVTLHVRHGCCGDANLHWLHAVVGDLQAVSRNLELAKDFGVGSSRRADINGRHIGVDSRLRARGQTKPSASVYRD